MEDVTNIHTEHPNVMHIPREVRDKDAGRVENRAPSVHNEFAAFNRCQKLVASPSQGDIINADRRKGAREPLWEVLEEEVGSFEGEG
jgi:hypothetical protein